MACIEVKSFASPEDKRPFVDKGEGLVVTLAGRTIIKARFEPGWHWKDHVAPLAGTETCQSPHLLYVLSGRMAIRMDDGTEGEFAADEAVSIEPGHDAWVVGDVPCTLVDFGISPTYAQHRG